MIAGRARGRRGAALAGLALAVGLTGACQNTGDVRSEAPGRTAAAEGTRDSAGGAVTGASGGVSSGGPNAPNNDRDTTALPGSAGSGTAAVGRPSGAPGRPGSGELHSGDPDDAAVRETIAVIHRSEADAARLAVTKAQSPAVREYAQAMLRAHEGPARGAPTPSGGTASRASDLVVPLQENATKSLAALRAASGAAFDRAYVTSEVAGHQGALQTLGRLETAAGGDALTDQIREMRASVQRHLEQARRLQSSLGGST